MENESISDWHRVNREYAKYLYIVSHHLLSDTKIRVILSKKSILWADNAYIIYIESPINWQLTKTSGNDVKFHSTRNISLSPTLDFLSSVIHRVLHIHIYWAYGVSALVSEIEETKVKTRIIYHIVKENVLKLGAYLQTLSQYKRCTIQKMLLSF